MVREAEVDGRARQGGMVLVVALVLLLAMTLLGINLAGGGSMELRMARNMQETSISLHSAEAGIAAVVGLVAEDGNPFQTPSLQEGDELDFAALFGDEGPALLEQNGVEPELFVRERALECPRVEAATSADKVGCDYYRIEAEHDGHARVRVARGAYMRVLKN